MLASVLCLFGAFLALAGIGAFTGTTLQAQDGGADIASAKQAQHNGVTSVTSMKNDVSPALRDQPPWPVMAKESEKDANANPKIPHKHVDVPDPVVQNARISALALLSPSIPSPIRNFDGIPFPGVGCNCAPPDTNGAVGATQYVQSVNIGLQVFDKATGNSVLGPVSVGSLWAGFGGVCETSGDGDPVVLYDQLAGRWLISQFAGTSIPNVECIAISTTNDATGTYHRYAFDLTPFGANFYDYPHLGVWPDGYYMAMNVFNSAGTAYLGGQAFAFQRSAMLTGAPAIVVSPGILPNGGNDETFLPADLDGSTLPPAGAPNPFLYWPGGASANTYRIMHFHADFATPANTTFTNFATLPSAGFTELCPTTRACVPQVGTTNRLDGIGDRLMFRLAYRRFAGRDSLVGNFSVSSNAVAGIRWFELRNVVSGPATVFQESTYQPDTTWRWMGSIGMDVNGSIAMGFSASSATITPDIRYAGRFATDPVNTLAQGEATLFVGGGSQTGTLNRWGDYSQLTIDPNDDTTFWYTQEYIPANGSFNWRTRIGSFRLPTTPTNNIVGGTATIVSAGGNGVLDPGETVTVALGLRNTGGPGVPCTTVNLQGTLQATGGVTNPPAAQNYGVICAGDPEVFRNFTFRVDPNLACGAPVTLSLAVVDGVENFGTATYTFPTGSTTTSPVENFDAVVAPALPTNWVGTSSGSGTPGRTVTTFPDTAPNAVFLSETTTVGLSEVTSAPVMISSVSRLSFRNQFNTELNFDGLVLEISIGGGAFQDILAAGGSFASGGYNSTLPTTFSNPLPSRMAWTGLSGGTAAAPTYITSVVNLPAAAVGQSVQFKWRQGADSSVAPATNPGSRIDTITLVSTTCATQGPIPSSAVSRKTHGTAGTFDIPLPLVAINGAVGIEPRAGTPAGAHTIIVTFPAAVTVGGVTVTNGVGTATQSVSGAVVTINLSGVADTQRLGVTLTNVNSGSAVGDVFIPMGLLSGDANVNGSVSSADVSLAKSQTGNTVSGTNFRVDVNASGTLTSGDVGLVKSRAGATLPAM